jgi:hypothetical protein
VGQGQLKDGTFWRKNFRFGKKVTSAAGQNPASPAGSIMATSRNAPGPTVMQASGKPAPFGRSAVL